MSSSVEDFFRQALCCQQHPASAGWYQKQDGLFLDEDNYAGDVPSDLTVLLPNDGCHAFEPLSDCLSRSSTDLTLVGVQEKHTEKENETSQNNRSVCSHPHQVSGAFHGRHEHVIRTQEDLDKHFQISDGCLEIFLIGKEHSWACLGVTRELFEGLVELAGIFGVVRDSILHYGERQLEVEVAPPRPQYNLLPHPKDIDSTASIELVYGLRYVEQNGRTNYKEFSLRQFVVYSKVDVTTSRSRWLFVSLPQVAQRLFEKGLDGSQNDTSQTVFNMHLLLTSTTITLWRPYLASLNRNADQHIHRLVHSESVEDKYNTDAHFSSRKAMRAIEDDLMNTVLALEATMDVVKTLESLYERTGWASTSSHSTTRKVDDVTQQAFSEQVKDITSLIKQARALQARTSNAAAIFSGFFDSAMGNSMRIMGEQAKIENALIADMTKKAYSDGASVKILGIITIGYLPVTVVLNFFSASFINVEGGAMQLADDWWSFLAISIPLTFLTFLIWKFCVNFQSADCNSKFDWLLKMRLHLRRPREGKGDLDASQQV